MSKKVWILTESYNLYDQQGDYHLGVFEEKPTAEKLVKFFEKKYHQTVSDSTIKHIINGGGRQNSEDQWFNLEEEEMW